MPDTRFGYTATAKVTKADRIRTDSL